MGKKCDESLEHRFSHSEITQPCAATVLRDDLTGP